MTRSTTKIGAVRRLYRPQVCIRRARRWRDWARGLAGRSRRVGTARIPAVMTLVDGRPRLVFIRNTFALGRPNPASVYRLHIAPILQSTLRHRSTLRSEQRIFALRDVHNKVIRQKRPEPAERRSVLAQPFVPRAMKAAPAYLLAREPAKSGRVADRDYLAESPPTILGPKPRLAVNTQRISSRFPGVQPVTLSVLPTLPGDSSRKAHRRRAPSREAQTLYSRTLSRSARREQPIQSSLPLLARKPAPAKDPLAASPLRADAQRQSSEESRLASRALAQPSPPPLDVSVVADQVMRELDRRVVAQRERMGRI